jgi:Di-haem oxidoreductase, putative peroxidase
MEAIMHKVIIMLALTLSIGVLMAELGSNIPSDEQLLAQRVQEAGSAGSGIFDVAAPPPGTSLRPVQRVPREEFGIVGPFPLTLQDLNALVYPAASTDERERLLEGMIFFTTPHTAGEGLGPMSNQPFCLGCHLNGAEAIASPGLVGASSCIPGSPCVSDVTRAARSTPTNFNFTALDPDSGGGRPPNNLDAINNTGRTAAFTVFADFDPLVADALGNPGFFDPLDGSTPNIVTNMTSQPFGGFVQHVRPGVEACAPDPIPPIEFDANLQGTPDPETGLYSSGFRRTVGERAGPPYIGRGLMEAVPTEDIIFNADPSDAKGHRSSLGHFASSLGCTGDCIAGRPNMIPRTVTVHTDANGKVTSVTGFVGGVGRFGLRANGVEILQFVAGGLQGELSFTSLLNPNEINFPTLFPSTGATSEPAACIGAASTAAEVHLSTPFSERNFLRNTAPPEFGAALLKLLKSPNPALPQPPGTKQARVQRGAELFGIDLVAFANRMIPGRMPTIGDGLDSHAINMRDRKLNCVGCHTPIQRTGQSPAEVGAEHLSFVWAPIFSDLLVHRMPVIDAERFSPRPRDPLVIARQSTNLERNVGVFNTFDLPRNFADDAFSNQKGSALGADFRTAPLMGLGKIGPPLLHDARVYLSSLTVDNTPAGTVTTNRKVTNAPLVVQTLDDAIRAAIELHDLPAPDDDKTPESPGAGCPVPPSDTTTNVSYGSVPQDVICPGYDTSVSRTHRSEAEEVIRRFRNLSPQDQQALIEFLRQL